MPEMTDKQLEESIKVMGLEVTEESKQKVREMMKRSSNILNTTKVKGSITELHVEISSPEMSKADFQFALPDGTVLKESLFGEMLGGSKSYF